jgi:hypothetical protein
MGCSSAALLYMYCASPARNKNKYYSRCQKDIRLSLVFFRAFEDLRILCLRTTGTMESNRNNGIMKLYEPSLVPTLYVGKVEASLPLTRPPYRSLGGCHSFLASSMATSPLLFHTSSHVSELALPVRLSVSQ